ncbi:hypothetical protein [Saccharopolyspora sp. 6V]|uniref:hypothetical protein n=1 Tax=Saccharopolyspora sp. 6V TaxID=2877239 RepID=UPI001CD57226|nr:hypothetical protein [Saccharopolyspora sp. 6V]MCA1195140.1 hypothetical protein [Saccharopolyspora sp. 6V]
MQTHGGAAADTAILARERYLTARLLVDWGRDGTYSHPLADLSHYARPITLDRALKGSVPEELTLIEGSAAAELTATLTGDVNGLSLVEVFAPYNRNSPLYGLDVLGAEVRYSIDAHTATGTVNYPQFVGVLRSLAPDRGTGTVELEALDRVEMLRRPVQFPVWATSQYWTERGYIRAQLADSQAVIDHCLRQCDTSPTPWRPIYFDELGVGPDGLDGCHFWLGGTGAHFPTVGHMDNATAQTFPNTDGGGPEMYATGGDQHPALSDGEPRPLCLAGIGNSTGPTLRYWARDRDLIAPGGAHFLGATLITTGSSYHLTADTTVLSVRIGSQREITLRVRAGRVYSTLVHHGVGQTWTSTELDIPADSRSRVTAIWDHSPQTGTRVAIALGDTVPTFVTVAGPYDGTTLSDDLKGLITVNHRLTVQDIGYTTRNVYGIRWDPTQLHRPARFAAALDPGRNRLTYLPDKSGSDAWDVISEVAAAEFGSVHWDERGVFRFWNYDTILSKQAAAVRTITTDNAASLGLRHSLDSVRNIWSVTTTKRVAQYGITYSSQSVDEFYLPPLTRKTWRVFVGSVQSPDPFAIPKHTSWQSGFPQWTDDAVSGYCVQYLVNGAWAENEFRTESDSNRPRCWIDGNGYLVITARNGWPEPMRYARNSGDTGAPALHIPGTVVAEADPLVISTRYQDSIDTYGGRNIPLSGDWYQDGYQSSTMLAALAERTTKPIPVTETITIPGDPRLQLGDAVDIRDPNGLGARLRAQIFGIRRTFDDGLTDTLTVEILDPPGAAQWDGTDTTDRWDYGTWS